MFFRTSNSTKCRTSNEHELGGGAFNSALIFDCVTNARADLESIKDDAETVGQMLDVLEEA
jgi:hypothetical protein